MEKWRLQGWVKYMVMFFIGTIMLRSMMVDLTVWGELKYIAGVVLICMAGQILENLYRSAS